MNHNLLTFLIFICFSSSLYAVNDYELITALFSDYTDKHRFVYLPDGTTAKYEGEEVFDFPIGTALIKTFSYQTKEGGTLLLETRLLLNKEDGWDALTYVWDIDRGDAFLALGGKTIEVTDVVTPTNANFIRYRAPNKNQCKECHLKDDAVEPIGPKPRNINKAIAYENGIKNNQIDHWAALGLLEEKPYSNDLMVDAFNDNHDINLRARSYLDINCGHCHSPEGSASSSGLYLSIDDKQFGVFKKPVAAGRGSGGLSYSIVPGQAEESILLFRMLSNEPDIMMPESGRALMHAEAIDLIAEWINEMK